MNDFNLQRRLMLKGMAALTSGAILKPSMSSAAVEDEIDWESIRASYPEQTPFLNFDNGCISPPTFGVEKRAVDAYKFANLNPCYNMFDVLDKAVPEIKAKLAKLADCDPGEVSLNRCTTVGMCTAIMGMPLAEGDEVLLSNWDYPSMINAWKQRAARDGIVIKPVSFGLMDSDEAIVEAYTRAITPRTKAIQLTHVIHWTGRAIPIAEICKFANEREILTVVDAAQSFAHIPLSFREIGCDYFATSFHKWLCAPIGTGMLIVKADRIDETWPLFPVFEELDGVDKFGMSNLGTYNNAAHLA
ncbi:MAG: aminotransferase class V-fold PLP-dependent enzyme, partial [Pseudomonadales bacterium]